MSKLIMSVEEILDKMNVTILEIHAKQESMDTSGNYRKVKIIATKEFVSININQKED